MSNSSFGIKNFFSGSGISNNTSSPFSAPQKIKDLNTSDSKSTLQDKDSIVTSKEKTLEAFSSNNNSTLNKLNNKQTLSKDDFLSKTSRPLPIPEDFSIEAKGKNTPKSISKPSKIPLKKEDSYLDDLKSKFDLETIDSIKKFANSPASPYPKTYACNIELSVIENTSSIKDFECSNLYEDTPFEIVVKIFDNEKVKNDPELKSKISKFISFLGTYDKSALASLKTLLERKPEISSDVTKIILDKLSNMMNENYDSRVGDKKSLVISALHDVSMPTDISQEGIGTCAGTSVQIQMAIRNPSEYLNMLDKLAKNESYTSVKGISIPPNFTFANEGGNNHDSRRTISAKIMQNAIMDYADAETRNYDSSKKDEGITTTQTAKALNDIVGVDVKNQYTWDYTGTQLLNFLKQSNPSYENPIEISLSYEKQGRDSLHSVNVVSLDENNVTIANPWGREETFPISQLKDRILSVSHPKSLEKEMMNISVSDNNIKESIIDDTKKIEILEKISIKDKSELIENTYAPWNGQIYQVKNDLSEKDKKMILNILDEMSQGGYAQNKVWLPRIKHFAPDLNLFLSKIDNGTEQYSKVKIKLLELNS